MHASNYEDPSSNPSNINLRFIWNSIKQIDMELRTNYRWQFSLSLTPSVSRLVLAGLDLKARRLVLKAAAGPLALPYLPNTFLSWEEVKELQRIIHFILQRLLPNSDLGEVEAPIKIR